MEEAAKRAKIFKVSRARPPPTPHQDVLLDPFHRWTSCGAV